MENKSNIDELPLIIKIDDQIPGSEVVNQENEKSELVMDSGTQDKPVMKEIMVKPDPLVCVVTHSNSMETNSKVEEEKIITKQ